MIDSRENAHAKMAGKAMRVSQNAMMVIGERIAMKHAIARGTEVAIT